MTPATLNLEIVKGLTFDPITIICKDALDVVVPLRGWSAFAGAKLDSNYIPLTATVTDSTAGEITIAEIPFQSTASLQTGVYQWQLALENAEGKRSGPYLAGTLTVTESVITF